MELTNKPKEIRQARDWQARRACEDAYKLERAGDYEGARHALRVLWSRIGDRPRLAGAADTRAEVLWRVGSLSGWLGSANQIPGAQEFACDLLTESITLFVSLGEQDKRAEAMGDLALCYWRLGAQDEGRALFRQALETAQTPQTKLRTLTNASTVENSSGRYADALTLLDKASAFLGDVSDDWIHGCYHSQRGLVYKNIGGTENLDHALIEYSAASMHFTKAGHVRYLARVENNIGFILLLVGRVTEALSHLDQARAIFVSLKDSGSVAQVNETRARVFLAEKKFADAERAIFAAITTFERGEDSSLLAEALMTQGSIFAGCGKYDSARQAFKRASEVAAAAGDSHLAAVAQLTMMEQMADVLSRAELLAAYRSADQYIGDHATQSELECLRGCRRIVINKLEKLDSVKQELIGGTLTEEVKHFEARLIAGAYGTIFATFSYHHPQKCSVSCNSCEKRCSPASRFDLGITNWTTGISLSICLFESC
ncbi:MAG TPA: tetratricopeptide repeat protein [Pyrinomonadaceae bacterium]